MKYIYFSDGTDNLLILLRRQQNICISKRIILKFLTDDYATQVLNSDPIKGVFTIVGPDIPVKSVFGGSGMYDVSPKKLYNPFLSLTMMGMLGYKHLNKDE